MVTRQKTKFILSFGKNNFILCKINNMALVRMTLTQYAKKAGYKGRQAIQYRIDNGLPLDGVVKTEYLLGRYILEVDLQELKKSLKKVA
jgi:hypothetical protein